MDHLDVVVEEFQLPQVHEQLQVLNPADLHVVEAEFFYLPLRPVRAVALAVSRYAAIQLEVLLLRLQLVNYHVVGELLCPLVAVISRLLLVLALPVKFLDVRHLAENECAVALLA